jgi:hypothetical protein
MLDFTYEYKDTINQITDRHNIKLRDYKIEPYEWDIIKQLQDVLGVCPSIISSFFDLSYIHHRFLRMQHSFFPVVALQMLHPSYPPWTILMNT